MIKLTQTTQKVLECLPATTRQIYEKLGVTSVTVNSSLRVLKAKGLAKRTDAIKVPHGECYMWDRTKPEQVADAEYILLKMPETRLTHWVGGNPWAKAPVSNGSFA